MAVRINVLSLTENKPAVKLIIGPKKLLPINSKKTKPYLLDNALAFRMFFSVLVESLKKFR